MLVRRPSVRRRVPHRVRVVVVKVPPRTLHASGRYHQWWCENAKYDRMLVHVLIVKYNYNNNNDHISKYTLHFASVRTSERTTPSFFFFASKRCSISFASKAIRTRRRFSLQGEEDNKEVISSSFPDVLPWWKRRRTATTTTTTTTTTTRDDEEETNDDDDENTTGNDENDDENNDPSARMEITHEPLFRTPPTYTRKTIFFYSSSSDETTTTTEKKVGRCKSENEH